MSQMSLQDRIKNFNIKYSVKLDLDAIEEAERIDAVFDSYTFQKKSEKTTKATTYFNALIGTLEKALTAKTEAVENAYYDLSEMDLLKYIYAFEGIVEQRNNESKNPRNRRPFEGMSFEGLLKKLKEAAKPYDKPIYNVWSDKMLDGKISFKELRSVTEYPISVLDRVGPNTQTSLSRESITNIYLAYKAMHAVREARGFWWKVFHIPQNIMEGNYYDKLKEKVTRLTQIKLITTTMMLEADKNLMKKAYEDTDRSIRRENMKDVNKKLQAEKNKKEETRREISAVAESLQAKVDDPKTKEALASEIAKKLPRCIMTKNTQKSMLSSVLVNGLIAKAQQQNAEFDQMVAGGENANKQLERMMGKIFQKAYQGTESLAYMEEGARLVAAQVITDVLMKHLSPVALDAQKYPEYTDGYVLNNPKKFEDYTQMDGSAIQFTEAKKVYDGLNRENVQINEINSVQKEAIVAPVVQESIAKDPIINKN